jgi:hypothetical protein
VKLLLTSEGVTNTSIRNVPVGLLSKPFADSGALRIPTAAIRLGRWAGSATSDDLSPPVWWVVSGCAGSAHCKSRCAHARQAKPSPDRVASREPLTVKCAAKAWLRLLAVVPGDLEGPSLVVTVSDSRQAGVADDPAPNADSESRLVRRMARYDGMHIHSGAACGRRSRLAMIWPGTARPCRSRHLASPRIRRVHVNPGNCGRLLTDLSYARQGALAHRPAGGVYRLAG